MNFERICYHSKKVSSDLFKAKFNQSVAFEIKQLVIRFNNDGKLDIFDKIIAYRKILCEKIQDGEYRLNTVHT